MFTSNKGDVYIGNYRLNKKHGKGRSLFNDGSKYEGNWSNNMFNGLGTFNWPNGDKYIGQWKHTFNARDSETIIIVMEIFTLVHGKME